MIDRATAERIKDTANIVDVVGDYVHLIKRGANYMGLCPFHNERTPSFSVNPARNFCHCFSCHKGGSPVNFLMEKEGISYQDALRRLAARYGIEVKEAELTDEERAQQSKRESLLIANEWAMQKMQSWLKDEEEGRNVGLQYFYGRGITEEAITAFKLGYALDQGFALANAAKKEGYDQELLKELGLLGTSQNGHTYDRFRGRVIFPIINSSGKVIAFGGRDLKGGLAKYINSPESDLYKKSNELYGLYQARNAISRQDKCFLVEGYMDVIGMWQSGMQNVIASSGTALTDGQIALIHRFTENVTLIYDGDAAGIKAALRGIDMLLSHKLNVKVLLLPDGDDPDSFARKHTPEEFRKYVEENETDIIRFKTKILMDEVSNDPMKRTQAIRSIVNSLAVIPDIIKRNVYIQECSKLLGISEEIIAAETAKANAAVMEEMRKKREYESIRQSSAAETSAQAPTDTQQHQQTTTAPRNEPIPAIKNPLYPFEREILRYCVRYGMLEFCEGIDEDGEVTGISVFDYIDGELVVDNVDFTTPIFKKIFELLREIQVEYNRDFATYSEKVWREIDIEKRAKYDRLSLRSDLDMRKIEKEEKKIEEEMRRTALYRLNQYTMDYPGRVLASHEEDDVRNAVNGLITEKYQLSKYHTRTAHVETEDNRLSELVPRTVTEWKNGILEQRLKRVIAEMTAATDAGDIERLSKLQQESSRIIEMRKQVAKQIGERIISPRLK